MEGRQTHGAGSRWAVTLVGAPAAGLLGMFASEVLDRLGWLDPPADALANFLKANVESGDLSNWIGFILFAALYGIVVRFAWRMQPRAPKRQWAMPVIPRAATEAERNARYLEALKGVPLTSELPLKRDTKLRDALAYAVSGQWGANLGESIIYGGGFGVLAEPLNRFREAAGDGDLRVWGRREQNALYEEIEPSFWTNHGVDLESSLLGETKTEPKTVSASHERFYDLMVNRAEVEGVWPHAG